MQTTKSTSHPKVSTERLVFDYLGFGESKPNLEASVSYELWGDLEVKERRAGAGKVVRRSLRCYRITIDGEIAGYVWQQEHRSQVKHGRLVYRTTYPLHWAWSTRDPGPNRHSLDNQPGTRRDAVARLLGYTGVTKVPDRQT